MLKYFIVQLSDSSSSFCHYSNDAESENLIPISILIGALDWAVKEGLSIQLLYPKFRIPDDYAQVLSQVDHTDFVPVDSSDTELIANADVVIFNSVDLTTKFNFKTQQIYIIRTSLKELNDNLNVITTIFNKVDRLNIVLTDVEKFDDSCIVIYNDILANLQRGIEKEYNLDHHVQLNLITDRLMLNEMNNCKAGVDSVTLAPNGNFYICPAFYLQGSSAIGNLEQGLQISNQQLYRLDHAPICRICDAWQCRRCIWLNNRLTHEVNTPGRQQCVISHLERKAAYEMQENLSKSGKLMKAIEIKPIDYIDPLEKLLSERNSKKI